MDPTRESEGNPAKDDKVGGNASDEENPEECAVCRALSSPKQDSDDARFYQRELGWHSGFHSQTTGAI